MSKPKTDIQRSPINLDKAGDVLLNIRVIPNARVTKWDGVWGDRSYKLRVHAPPVDGAANLEIINFLHDFLDVKRHAITLESGEKSRDKVIKLRGVSLEDIKNKILGS